MAQNAYNNYIKRQAQATTGTPILSAPKPDDGNVGVGFKKRVMQGLGTQNTSSTTTNQYTSPTANMGTIAPLNDHTQASQDNINISTPIQPDSNKIKLTPNTYQAPVNVGVTPSVSTPPVTTPSPVSESIQFRGTGLNGENSATPMPVSVDSGLTRQYNAPAPASVPVTASEVNNLATQIAQNPQTNAMARSTGMTPQDLAKELLEQQKAQMQKDWELKQKELEAQRKQTEESYQQSITDMDKKYGQTVDTLNQNRYTQMQDLNVSGVNRGIQYSPQQLGLENVVNINHNKSLAEASQQRNELLTELNKKLADMKTQLALGSENSVNEYNKAMSNLMAQYQKQMMEWEWDKQMTAEERAWQEQQVLKDREWQEKMDKINKEWQTSENDKDRAQSRSGSNYGGGGYSSTWSGSKGWQNYGRGSSNDWVDYGGYKPGGYSGFSGGFNSGISFADPNQNAQFFSEVKNDSTDVFNAVVGNNLKEAQIRADIYKENIDPLIDYATANGADKATINKLIDTRDIALNHMFNKAMAGDTNGLYKVKGNEAIKFNKPLRTSFIARNLANKELNTLKYKEKNAYNDERRKKYTKQVNDPLVQKKNRTNNKAVDMVENIKKNGKYKPEIKIKSKPSAPKKKSGGEIKREQENRMKKSSQNIKKRVQEKEKKRAEEKKQIRKRLDTKHKKGINERIRDNEKKRKQAKKSKKKKFFGLF